MPVRTASLLLISAVTALFADPPGTLSLKVLDGSAPPGEIVQIQIKNTEPMPILSGRGSFESDFFSSFDGFAIHSPLGDASATAVVQGNRVKLSAISPQGGLGLGTDYPIITVAARISANRPLGSRTVLDVNNLTFVGPFGIPYPVDSGPGEITASNGLSISNVVPGSASLPAGAQVTIFGTGFAPDTRIKLDETALSRVQFISPTEIRVTLGQPAVMHGMEVRARNRDRDARYYSYQRTVPEAPSTHPVLARTEPLFSPGQFTQAQFASQRSDGTRYFGFAFQNTGAASSTLAIELTDTFGRVLGTASLTVGANRRVVRSAGELIAAPAPVGTFWRVTASAPVQMMEIAGDAADSSAAPAAALFAR